jgi:hypothetical protein
MIRYHGGPITPGSVAARIWETRHALISFAYPEQLPIAAEVAQSFVLDNGAFSEWRQTGAPVDSIAFRDWVQEWELHPGYDWCLIPDVIDGDERVNDRLISEWPGPTHNSVPVWHLHESIDRLRELAATFPRVALGSSGQYATPMAGKWWQRIGEALPAVCDEQGRPKTKLHGLRMMNPGIFSHVPLSSVDSCGVARNIGLDVKWDTGYLRGLSKHLRAEVIANRYERHASASRWSGFSDQPSLDLLG